jgi:uncharacterized damage-inducible protein DinB
VNAPGFLSFSAFKLEQLCSRIGVCLDRMSEEQFWTRPGPGLNSPGNLCLHLAGNVRQWILHGIGGQPDTRHRDAEFAAEAAQTKSEVWQVLHRTVEESAALIRKLPQPRLEEIVRPQNYEVTVLEAIYHVVEHFAQHTGQIILLTRQYTQADLGFYRHLSNTRHPGPPPVDERLP